MMVTASTWTTEAALRECCPSKLGRENHKGVIKEAALP